MVVERAPMNREFSVEEEEIPLYETSQEREEYDEQANFYAIITATEHLERAYARDAIDQKEYVEQCKKLISQFRLAERVLSNKYNTETFMAMYDMNCPRAVERLLVQGVPEYTKGGNHDQSHISTVADTVQCFITAMDALKLDQRAVDEIQPVLADLMDALTSVPETPNDFEPNRKVEFWLQKLNSMRAVEEIDDDEARQLIHDLESAYGEFTRYLRRGI